MLGDVLIEGAGHALGGQDPLDGGVAKRAVGGCVREGFVELIGSVALAEEQDLSDLCAPHPCAAEADEAEELGGALAHRLEGEPDLLEVDGAPSLGRRMEPSGVDLEAGSARAELVARDQAQVGGVDEELTLGDPHRDKVGDVLVRDGVAIATPVDEAVD